MADDKRKQPAEDGEGEKSSAGGGLMTTLILAVVVAVGTFGMVWMAADAPPPAAPCEIAETPLSEEELLARTASYVELDTMTVSLAPEAGADHLRVTIVLGLPAEQAPFTDVQFLRLRDRFTERLRTLDTGLITDPAAMPQLKAALLEMARGTLGQDAVLSVLITEFLIK